MPRVPKVAAPGFLAFESAPTSHATVSPTTAPTARDSMRPSPPATRVAPAVRATKGIKAKPQVERRAQGLWYSPSGRGAGGTTTPASGASWLSGQVSSVETREAVSSSADSNFSVVTSRVTSEVSTEPSELSSSATPSGSSSGSSSGSRGILSASPSSGRRPSASNMSAAGFAASKIPRS